MNSLFEGFLISSAMGKGIVLLQLAGSVLMFATIIGKWKTLAKARSNLRRFGRDIMGGPDVLAYHLQRRHSEKSAIENIYEVCCDRLLKLLDPAKRAAIAAGVDRDEASAALTRHEAGLIQSICDHQLDIEEIKLERGMSLIATIVALAPMLGLLGTVWGVLDAFADMGAAKTATIATMAPAISSALVTTVVGLIIAFPGIIFDNHLRGVIRGLCSDMEGFADDLMGRISLEFQGRN